MKRRDVLTATGALALGACASDPEPGSAATTGQRFNWKMVTTWPPGFPGMQTGVMRMVEQIAAASGGRLSIKVYAGNELVPPLEVFDAVSRGTVEMGHGAAYYWKGKAEAAQFFTTIPFGLTFMEMNGWLYYGGGLELYRELYADFDLVPFPAGNTGVQMGGWFNREINSIADLQGLKMRIPGLGGEALARAGGTPVTLPGAEIFTALQTGVIDACEWVGPYNDMILGLPAAARYYYYPGWHEPGPTLETLVNKQAFDTLPPDLQMIVQLASAALNEQMTAEFTARNAESLAELQNNPNVEMRRFPDDVLRELRGYTEAIMLEMSERDPRTRRIFESFQAYRQRAAAWTRISETAYLNSREL
ncbi:MAG: ABC transporter substrate-binding protein [Gammaproteobacteria bacterium]|nr:ABC transporter substrate-binding protein [Gammaproteobacteria bacterium]